MACRTTSDVVIHVHFRKTGDMQECPPKNIGKRNELLKITYDLISESDHDMVSLSMIAEHAQIKKPLVSIWIAYFSMKKSQGIEKSERQWYLTIG